MSTSGYERAIQQNSPVLFSLKLGISKRVATDASGQPVPGVFLAEHAGLDLTTVTSVVARVTLPGVAEVATWTFAPDPAETTSDYLLVERFYASVEETALTGRALFDATLYVGPVVVGAFYTAIPIQAKR